MKLYLDKNASLSSPSSDLRKAKIVEVFANYIRVPQRELVSDLLISRLKFCKTVSRAELTPKSNP
jgi:hypothetical protein